MGRLHVEHRAAPRDVAAFSPKGDYLMHCSVDGILKVWDTRTGSLKTEFVPSSHLTATCKCLCWCPANRFSDTPKRKKRKKAGDDCPSAAEDSGLVALGTTAGSVLLYSVVKGELHSRLENGHGDVINDICWHSQKNILYTCSSDKHLAEWDLSLGKVKYKWKASKSALYSICLVSKNRLISAGNLIKLWDLEKYEVISKYSGHTTEVLQLLPVIKNFQTFESSYFLSAAVNDRLVSAWSVNTNKGEKNAVASFSLPEEPLKLSLLNIKDQPIHLSVVTKGGQVLYFEHVLNGNMKKPLRSKLTIRVSSPTGKAFPILASYLVDDNDHTIIIAHGSFLRPVFERVVSKGAPAEICLEHSETALSIVEEGNVQRVISGELSKDLTVLTPSLTISSGPAPNTSSSGKKKKKTEFTMQERLNAISFDSTIEGPPTQNTPVADSMAVLLMQGLMSSDKDILNEVLLKNQNESVIQNTVRKLDIQAIVPLIKELTQRMSGPSSVLHKYAQWIKVTLSIHTSYLISFPDLMDTLSSLYQLLDARMAMFTKLTRLQGKLSLLLSQVKSRDQEESGVKYHDQSALLMYQDESSDEDFYLKKNLDDMVASESEYDWNSDDDAKEDSENTKSNNTDEKDESDD